MRILSIEGCWLTISGRWGLTPTNARVDLRRASPDLQEANVRLYRALVSGLVIAVAPISAVFAIPARVIPNRTIEAVLESYALIWMALCLWMSWRFVPRIDFVRIRSKRGGVLLDIVKDRNAPADYEAFLDELRARIESSAIS
jgi:hypothetical protein